MYSDGWYQVAFERDLSKEVNPAAIGSRPLVLVRFAGAIRVFDAACPHRGAHLGYGGRLDGNAVVCPFHGYRIGFAGSCGSELMLKEYAALAVGGLVFVRLSSGHNNGFAALLSDLDQNHFFVPGFTIRADVPAPLVIENAFDNTHFRPVHGIRNEPHFHLRPSERGELGIEGIFEIPPSPWQRGNLGEDFLSVPFVARAFSPGIVVSQLGGVNPYWVLTAATPVSERSCDIRISLILPPTSNGKVPDVELCQYLLRQSKAGIEKDRAIWENLCPLVEPHLTPQDTGTQAFRTFCEGFREELCA